MLHLAAVLIALSLPASLAAQRIVGTVFSDCAVCPEMVVVPAGRFTMGSLEGEEGRYRTEGPRHVVTIARPFAVGRYEVTRGQFAGFVEETGYKVTDVNCTYFFGTIRDDDPERTWEHPGFPQDPQHPVVCVSWDDAKAYAAWLARKTGKAYRLLSEAEWEYSARAGTPSSRPWGDDADAACPFANVHDLKRERAVPIGPERRWLARHGCDDGQVYTARVGSYRANGFGLYDMIGNVWEWTEDCWNDSYDGAPSDGSPWLEGDCSRRVDKGGGWRAHPRNARSAFRHGSEHDNRPYALGFRIARGL